ncbi:RNA-guided endonuclease InsQ/TnpB family protein [Billgrantia diversa]|uniref:RNA-guided endonuclease InsQ/TnpB family protein n=1 Tax=Halomonas sp. MCCC 1A13316 TaxID=2733487 RepID=UPI001E315B20|nr:transposase [Halomonas sp. MCCC 1A13316]
MLGAEDASSVLGHKDQVCVKHKNAVPAGSAGLLSMHRPNILEDMKQTKTLKVRVKDKHAAHLGRMARSVNFVWNYLNELSARATREKGLFLSAYDMDRYTKGAGKDLGLHSQTLQEVSREYATRRKQFRKTRLAWRKSRGVRRSLGWVPFKSGAAKWKNGQIFFNGQHFKVWDSFGLSQYKFRSGSFNEDARGRWCFNVVVEVEVQPSTGQGQVGIDLGLKDVATCSDGVKLENGRFYRDLADKLATAQRARNKRRVKALHAKIKNRRKDALHKFSRRLVDQHGEIVVGDVSSTRLAKTRMAKSVLDAGWGQLKTMLEYKCDHAGIVFREVREAYTTRTCSLCGSLSGPQGVNGLRVRDWECAECGVLHDRDVNAARNILSLGAGRCPPAVGITSL